MSDTEEQIARAISKQISQKVLYFYGEKVLIEAVKNNINFPSAPCCVRSTLGKEENKIQLELCQQNNLDPFDDDALLLLDRAWQYAKDERFCIDIQAEDRLHRKGDQTVLINVPYDDHEIVKVLEEKKGVMENLPTEKEVISNELKKFNLADSEIAKLKELYSSLVIAGAEDQDGYGKVDTACKFLAKKCIEVEKVRKATKDFYLKTGKAIDAEAKRITQLLMDIKTPLTEKQKVIDDIFEKIKQEAELKASNTLNYRIIELAKYNYATDTNALGSMTDEAFETELGYAKEEFQKELERKDKLKEDEEKLEADRKKFEDEKAEFEKQKLGVVYVPKGEEGLVRIFPTPDQINVNAKSIIEEKEDIFSTKDPFDDMSDVDQYKAVKPLPIDGYKDYSPLHQIAFEFMDFVDDDEKYTHNHDYHQKITNELLNMIYGPAGVDFISKRRA